MAALNSVFPEKLLVPMKSVQKFKFFVVSLSFKHLMYTVLIPTEVIIDAWHSIVQAQRGSTSTIDKVKKVVHPSEYLLLLRGNQSIKRKKCTLSFPVETYQSLHKD